MLSRLQVAPAGKGFHMQTFLKLNLTNFCRRKNIYEKDV